MKNEECGVGAQNFEPVHWNACIWNVYFYNFTGKT
jgi:hypothetical protein